MNDALSQMETDILFLFPETRKFKIKFRGKEYLLIGDYENGGAIATEHQYENFEESFAHLCKDGSIKRYGIVIGKREHIEIIEELK